MMMGMILIRKGMMMIIQEDELMDDFVYWDSIGGHVEDQARPANRQNGVRSLFKLALSSGQNFLRINIVGLILNITLRFLAARRSFRK